MSVGWVGEKKLSLCSQSCLNVLLAIDVLLTSVDYADVTCRNGVKDQAVARMKNLSGAQAEKETIQETTLQVENSKGNTLGTSLRNIRLEFPSVWLRVWNFGMQDRSASMQLRISSLIAVPPVTKNTLFPFKTSPFMSLGQVFHRDYVQHITQYRPV